MGGGGLTYRLLGVQCEVVNAIYLVWRLSWSVFIFFGLMCVGLRHAGVTYSNHLTHIHEAKSMFVFIYVV